LRIALFLARKLDQSPKARILQSASYSIHHPTKTSMHLVIPFIHAIQYDALSQNALLCVSSDTRFAFCVVGTFIIVLRSNLLRSNLCLQAFPSGKLRIVIHSPPLVFDQLCFHE